MRAITEIPANTPRPMGKTEIFLPGREKGSGSPDSEAAAVPSAPAVAVADGSVPRLSAAGGWSAGGGVAWGADSAESVVLGVGSAGAAALEEGAAVGAADEDAASEEALASAELEALGAALSDEDETAAESVALGSAAVNWMAPDEEGAADSVTDDDAAESVAEADAESVAEGEGAAESEADSEAVGSALAESAEDDETASELDCGGAPEMVIADDPAGGRMVIAGEADMVTSGDELVAVGTVVSVVAPEALEAGAPPGAFWTWTVHLVTFSKASFPVESLMGVKVISQVSIRVPAGVTVSFVVVSDVWLPGACRTCSKGRALAWAENKNKRAKRARNEGLWVGRIVADNIVL